MDRRVRNRSAFVGTVHRGSQGRHGASEANCFGFFFFFLPTNEGEGRRKQPDRVRGGGGAEERRLSFSERVMTVRQFSSTADVTQT